MTRLQAKENLIAFGIQEPTEEQITNYLNQVNGEVTKEKNRADKYKQDAQKADELQKQLDDIAKQNMSELDLANKKYEDAEKLIKEREETIAKLQKEKLIATITSKLAEKGLTGETYSSYINAISLLGEEEAIKSAVAFADTLSKEKEELVKTANAEAEKRILEATPNPDGGDKDGDDVDDEDTSYAAQYAKKYSQKMNTQKTAPQEETNAPVDF